VSAALAAFIAVAREHGLGARIKRELSGPDMEIAAQTE
jgi:hypothetical protein